jgi:hypothetical protein
VTSPESLRSRLYLDESGDHTCCIADTDPKRGKFGTLVVRGVVDFKGHREWELLAAVLIVARLGHTGCKMVKSPGSQEEIATGQTCDVLRPAHVMTPRHAGK